MFRYKVLEISQEVDLTDFTLFLWQQKIPNRVNEQQGLQVLWVATENHVVPVRDAFAKYQRGEIVLRRVKNPNAAKPVSGLRKTPPLTAMLIILSVLGGLLTYFDGNGQILHWLTFQDFVFRGNSIVFQDPKLSYAGGEYWRLLTPVLIHFGLAHTIFNSLWVWEFGRRIETGQNAFRLAGVVVIVGIGSNIVQYLWSPNVLFGGMSGVIYGMLGYCVAWDRLSPNPALRLPNNIVIFMLIWLVICMTDILSSIGISVANAAHVSGLVIGVLMGIGGALIEHNERTGGVAGR